MVPYLCKLIEGIPFVNTCHRFAHYALNIARSLKTARPSNVFENNCFQVSSGELNSLQSNRATAISTVEPSGKITLPSAPSLGASQLDESQFNRGRFSQGCEILLIFLVFALFAGQLPPDVNESHYLTKAKHFWNPDWCPNDIFLSSSFAHWCFYVLTGWLTKFMSLSAVAWTGRVLTWGLLAVAWRRLSWSLIQVRWVAVVSAIFFLLLNEHFHLAGEWVVGGFEAKGIAYFFVLMALGSMVNRDWIWVWPFLGAASAFHVLVGGWGFLAAIFAWIGTLLALRDKNKSEASFQQIKTQLLPLTAGIALALIGAIPPLMADRSAAPEIAIAARSIYVNHRIAHHLSFDVFPALNVARFVLVMVFWYLLSRWLAFRWDSMYRKMRPLFLFCLGSLIISFGGLLLSGLAEQNDRLAEFSEGLLRFYWFRLSDFAVPMATAMASCAVVCFWLKTDRRVSTRISCLVFVVCIVAASGVAVYQKFEDPRPRADRRSLPNYEGNSIRTMGTYRNWLKVCDWIANNTPTDAMFITPHEQQTFKWYAGRSEVVSWKDVPQDSHGILDWSQRLVELYEPQRRYENGLMSYSDQQLRTFAKTYGADYLVVPQRHVDLAAVPTNLKQVYPIDVNSKSTYVVFEF